MGGAFNPAHLSQALMDAAHSGVKLIVNVKHVLLGCREGDEGDEGV
jgi:hypothetical protein